MDLDLIELHSLQFGDDAQQISPWSDRSDVYEWKDKLQDFSDTAVILNQLGFGCIC